MFRRLRLVAALSVVSALLITSPAAAQSSRVAEVARLRDDVLAARGPNAYTALRALWSAWEHGDPAPIEASLDDLAKNPRLTGEVRAYAGLLRAYAKRRRGDLAGSVRSIRELGYLSEFSILGPFDNEGKGGFLLGQGPESVSTDSPLGLSWPGKERPVRFRTVTGVFESGWVDTGSLLRPEENLCAFAFTTLRSEKNETSRRISLWVGQSGVVRVYWNGKEVARDDKYRAFDADRLGVDVTLGLGENQLVLKVCGDEQAPLFSVRVGERDGTPAKGIKTGVPDGAQVHALTSKTESGKPATFTLRGPLASFQKMVGSSGFGGTPAIWEDYARYLDDTASDDSVAHTARALAIRAAEKAPTIPRLLLAGSLAEDLNQQRAWTLRASKAGVAKGKDRRALLLTQAKLQRAGVNWRESIPLYDELLATDPDDDQAVLARVELYTEAGLPETAYAFLQRALARNPNNVLLLRSATVLLQEQGRGVEAIEMMDRYAALRFDDPTNVRAGLQRALARRDHDEVVRLAARLSATSPDNAALLIEAARAHVTLGDLPTAIGYAKRASELLPEDAGTLKALADFYALAGRRNEQLTLYRKIAELKPQDKTIRDYLAHREPEKPRADEVEARDSKEFLAKRGAPANGQTRRTLSDLQVTTVFQNGLASRFHQVVFQPLTDAAAAAARQYAFGYEADSEIVELRSARIYKKDGSIVDASDTGDAATDDPTMAMYTSQRAFYVNFPRIDPGDVVEVRYRVEDVAHRNAFADYFGEVNYFESREPVGRAEYVLITPKSRVFYFNKPNVPGLKSSVKEQGNSRIYRFVAEALPAQNTEPLQPPGSELFGYVHVSTYASWDAMGKWYWGLVRDQFVADDEVRRRVAAITKGMTTPDEKVRAIYGYVVQNTRYVALEFGIHGYKPYRCAQIFARGFGDCKDKATLIVSMLKEAGIPATIVIVRTQMRGDFGTEPASLAPFDHAIAYVPSLDLYLDGTAEDTGSRELPAMDRGALALQINEGNPKLTRLPDPGADASVTTRRIVADLSASKESAGKSSVAVEFSADVSGVNAPAWRRRYRNVSSQLDRIKEDLGSDLPGFEAKSVKANDLTQIEQNVHVEARGTLASLARRDGATYSVPAGPREYLVREYTPLSTRKRDIKIPARSTQVTEWTVKLPAGATITRVPDPASEKSKFGHATVSVQQSGASVTVRTEIAIDVPRVAAADYAAFRAFCERADHALGARVVYQTGGH